MDIEIPASERKKTLYKRIAIWVGCSLVALAAIAVVWSLAIPSVKRSDLIISQAERGDVESSVSVTGHVVPATEVIVSSPVASSIVEVYCREGDSVMAGTPLLRLDLQSTEVKYQQISDELAMKQNEIEQSRLNSHTKLTDLEMRIKTRQMAADQLKAQVENEKRLDSVGSGTGERIRQAELAYRTACMEIEQMRRQLANERRVEAAAARSKQLEGDICLRNLQEAARTLDDAKLCAPISGIVTFINQSIGGSVGAGEKVALVSDLSRFKVAAEVGESQSDKVNVGAPVRLRIGKKDYNGHVSNLNAKSNSGVVPFTIVLEEPDAGLRSGLTARGNVVYDLKENVVRIPYGSYYAGPGPYRMFVVKDGDTLERRDVMLGDVSAEWVEVKSGIEPGEEVVISGDSNIKTKQKIKLR